MMGKKFSELLLLSSWPPVDQ